MKYKKIITSTVAILICSSTVVHASDTSLNWRGNSFYKTDENRYERAKTPKELEEEREANTPKRSLTDIMKDIALNISNSLDISDIAGATVDVNNGVYIPSDTTDLINAGDGKFYSGSQSLISFTGSSRKNFLPNEFIEAIAPIAMELGVKYSVFPSVIIANAAQETGWGNSSLTRDCNNMGGVKAYDDWSGPLSSISSPSSEDSAYYRGYESVNAAIEDKLLVLQAKIYTPIREAKTPQDALKFHETGYAGSPSKDTEVGIILNYAPNNLSQYDVQYKALLAKGSIKHTPKTREDIRNNDYLN